VKVIRVWRGRAGGGLIMLGGTSESNPHVLRPSMRFHCARFMRQGALFANRFSILPQRQTVNNLEP